MIPGKWVFTILCCPIFGMQAFGQMPPDDPAYELVFSDEFDGRRLDSTKWSRTFPWHQPKNFSTFCQHGDTLFPLAAIKRHDANGLSDTANCLVSQGSLKLVTKKERYLEEVWNWPLCTDDSCKTADGQVRCDSTFNPPRCFDVDLLPFDFTTAMLYSKQEFRYGWFEMRFRLPPRPPAPQTFRGHGGTFWLFSGSHNYWSEIDIFEINAEDDYCFATGNCYWKKPKKPKHARAIKDQCHFSPDTWHTASLKWNRWSMKFYYDGILRWKSRNHPRRISPMPIIINCGGNYTPTDNYCTPFDLSGADSTYFPYTIEIDYVKVWQRKKKGGKGKGEAGLHRAINPEPRHQPAAMTTDMALSERQREEIQFLESAISDPATNGGKPGPYTPGKALGGGTLPQFVADKEGYNEE